jgi:D-3-phosphoglycerate dehydrogenase
MEAMKNILIATSSFAKERPELLDLLRQYGFQVFLNPWSRQLKESELVELLELHRPVGLLAGTEPVTNRVMEKTRDHLLVISRVGVGWDNVDRDAAAKYGILVYRTSGVLTQAVAELTIGLILGALRSIPLHDRMIRAHQWGKRMGGLLAGKLIGIIGFGAIGQRVGELARAFGAEVAFYDSQPVESSWAHSMPFQMLLEQADIISLHASGKEQILGEKELRIISGRNAILVNTARGELIDEEALFHTLKDGQIAYVCLDVFWEEPYAGQLCNMDNVILTPHVGSYAREARHLMEETAVHNLIMGLKEKKIL